MYEGRVSLSEAETALRENLALLDPAKHKSVRNLNIALLGMLLEMKQVRDDVSLLHNKIQPVLAYIVEENDDLRARLGRR
jgi:hypothetical protein